VKAQRSPANAARALTLWTLATLFLLSSLAGLLLYLQFDSRTGLLLDAESSVVRALARESHARGSTLRSIAPALETELRAHGLRFALFSAGDAFLAGDATLHRGSTGGAAVPQLPGQRQVSFVALDGGYAILATDAPSTLRNRLTIAIPFGISIVLSGAAWLLTPLLFARVFDENDRLQEREQRAVEERTRRLLSDASHELRTPLAVLRGYFSVLARGAILDTSLAERILATMEGEVSRLQTLVENLLRLARIERAPSGKPPESVDLRALVSEVAASVAPLADGRLTIDATDPVDVLVDRTDLRDAVQNVVDNALKYAPEGPVVVRVRRVESHAEISVIDTGPGIPAEERMHVFERFFRGSNRADVDGSGLGLAIVRRVVERAEGSVAIDDAAGGGTEVTIRLPLAGASP
jgi:signal transduction histidine kinase